MESEILPLIKNIKVGWGKEWELNQAMGDIRSNAASKLMGVT